MADEKGFSLIEVLFGVMIFAFGMLGVAAMLTATVRDNSFSSGLSEATMLASSQLDVLLAVPYGSAGLLDGSGTNNGSVGLVDGTVAQPGTVSDFSSPNQGKNGKFTLSWNVSVDDPVVGNKTINVIVTWNDKDNARQVSFRAIRGQ